MNIKNIVPCTKNKFTIYQADKRITLKVNEDIYFDIDILSSDVIKQIDGKKTIQQINEKLKTKYPHITNNVIYSILYVNPKFKILLKKMSKEKNNRYLYLRLDLFSSEILDGLTSKLKDLFNYRVFFFNVLLLVISISMLFINDLVLDVKNILKEVSVFNIAISGMLAIFISFFHELGHASGCKKIGIKHGNIGVGFYLLTPVFYTDVSEVWTQKKKNRILVNLGGVYFELIILNILLLSIPFLPGSLYEIVILLILNILILFVYQVNPFIRSDGYWVLVDYLGEPNLKRKSFSLLKNFQVKNMFNYSFKEVIMIFYSFSSFLIIVLIILYNINSGIIQGPIKLYSWFCNFALNFPYINVLDLLSLIPSVLLYVLLGLFLYKFIADKIIK